MSAARSAKRSSPSAWNRRCRKQQILELYLNSIFLGRNAYGVQAASRAYFDKDVNELTLPEAAYLAVLPKAPANYDPVRATQKALDRRNYVLREMYKNGYIKEDQWKAAAATPLGTIRYGSSEKFRQQGGYFMEEVRRELIKRFGENADNGPNSLYAGGLWVRTSMDPKLQDAAAQALRDGLTRFDGGRGWRDTGLSVDMSKDWAGPARPGAGRSRLPRLAQGGRSVQGRRRSDDRLHQRVARHACRLRRRRCRSAASAGGRSIR